MSTDRGTLSVESPRGSTRTFLLTDGSVIIGRSAECDIVLRDKKASRRHARLDVTADAISITDLSSRQGTIVDGVRTEHAALAGDSRIQIGDYTLLLQTAHAAASESYDEEYIEIEAGKPEPTIVETLLPGEMTISHDGLEQSMGDTTVARLAVYLPGAPREVPLLKETIRIGRDPGCDIVIDDPASSRRHAELKKDGDRYVLRDLDSKNGTWIREKKIRQQKLFNGTNFRIGDTFFIYKAPFAHEALTLDGSTGVGAADSNRRPVVVLPGIMGSELFEGDQLFWPNLTCALRQPEKMAVGSDAGLTLGGIARQVIMIRGVIKLDAYSKLVDYLEEGLGYQSGKDLLQFAYDWRQDNRDSAQKLKVAIDDWRENTIGRDTKFVILCHSMGALVSRYYLQCLGGAANVERFVAMGGAHFGAPFSIRGLLYGPDLLPLGIGRAGLHAAMLTMPSAYQLVPPYPAAYTPDGEPIDLYEDDSWVKEEYRPLLHSARRFHEEIGPSVNVPTTCIFGYGVKTCTRVIVDKRGKNGWEKVRFMLERAGDNRVVDQYGYLQGADIHPVKQHHGSLWTDNDVKMRLRLELLRQ